MPLNHIYDQILPLVRKPGRYIGGELHAILKSWDRADLRFALVFPELYEIGMSHYGLQILYHILNSRENMLAERAYCPDIDMERQLRAHGMPLISLESQRPLADFDVIGITLPYELCYTNILTVLDLAGLPLYTTERDERYPLVIGGGSCSMNPEPVADFFDAIVLGDGEEIILEIGEAILRHRQKGGSRPELLEALAAVDGVYIPSFFSPEYVDGELAAVRPLRPGHQSVYRRVLPRLPAAGERGHPLVPVVRPVHDRLGIEIARGCTRGCRFCQAGIIYRPVRERTIDEIMTVAEEDIGGTGFDELALLSLSTGDYACLPELMVRLMDRFAGHHVSVSMPSMRVGTLTPEIMEQIRRVRKTGFTVAPEAGTDRLREVINKGITEADLLDTCRNAFAMGWNLIKLYFMIGLPTETWEDIEAIVELARQAKAQAGPSAKRVQVNVSVGTFVPKPHTPFQWERQLTLEESMERINFLKKKLPRKGFKLKWHDPRQSYLEGVFSRGDRRLAGLIENAWRAGVRLDGWSEHYHLENWQQAAHECGLELDRYLLARDPEKPLPWDHLDSGVDRQFFLREHEKALQREYTPDCRNQGCQKCGLCDFKTIRPVVHPRNEATESAPSAFPFRDRAKPAQPDRHFSYRVRYARLGQSRFYGHLEILQLIFRSLTRAGIEVLYTQGYNPSPRVSFSPALPVGMESEIEYFDMDLAAPLQAPDEILAALNQQLPAGMSVTAIEPKPDKEPEALLVEYTARLECPLTDAAQASIDSFLAGSTHVIERVRKNKRREIDIRPLVHALSAEDTLMKITLLTVQGQAGISPGELLRKVVGLSDEEALRVRLKKDKAVVFSANP